jgi:hypothetical protein
MIKISLVDVGREKAFQINDKIVKYLRRTLRLTSKIERKFIVYDTNIDLIKVKVGDS